MKKRFLLSGNNFLFVKFYEGIVYIYLMAICFNFYFVMIRFCNI